MKFIYSVIALFFCVSVYAQNSSNEWIDFGQKYFKVAVAKTGVYRIAYSDLVNNGIDPTTFDSRSLQIFYKGEEQYIYVSSEGSSVFGTEDYIEFFGEKNTGWLDTLCYENIDEQLNEDLSLYTDTASYFLTWNNTFNNKRYQNQKKDESKTYLTEKYCLKTDRVNYNQVYIRGEESPFVKQGEGWSGNIFGKGASKQAKFNTSGYVDAGVPTSVKFAMGGVSNTTHYIQTVYAGLSFDTTFFGKKNLKKELIFDNALQSNTAITVGSDPASSVIADNNSLSYVQITYTHGFDVQSTGTFMFGLPASNSIYRKLSIENPGSGSYSVFYDKDNGIRTTSVTNGVLQELYISQPNESSHCIIAAESALLTPEYIKEHSSNLSINGRFYDFSDTEGYDYIIISHRSLWDGATEYYEYRKQEYDCLLLDIEELYNQFGYGIKPHPASISNFLRFAFSHWNKKPEFVFLMGKSLHLTYYRNNKAEYRNHLVPTMGMPSSDMLFASSLRKANTDAFEAKVSIGRLAARSNTQITDYLEKIKEHENAVIGPWVKQVLHFGGGQNAYEQNLFKNYLKGFEDILEGNLFGAKVYTFLKNDSQPITETRSEKVKDLIDEGVSLMTFFGHAAAGSFDQSIDDPEVYNNKGRYPILLANSCYSGDIHTTSDDGISEKWVLNPKRGAIAFLANVNLGYPNELDRYSTKILNHVAQDSYGEEFGTQIQRGVNDVLEEFYFSNQIYTCMDMTLHGDPAVKMNTLLKPDLAIEVGEIAFSPEQLTTDIDSFYVDVGISNYGMSAVDSFDVQVKRILPSGIEQFQTVRVDRLDFKESVQVSFPMDKYTSPGKNVFVFTIDALNEIEEVNESNNETTLDAFVKTSNVVPSFPYEFAIYPYDTVTLIASSSNYEKALAECTFEIDIDPSFGSAQKQTGIVNHQGGVVEWKVPGKLTENVVYYWRVGTIDDDSEFSWRNSSFIYIDGKTGWSQASVNQFSNDDFKYISIDPKTEEYQYIYTPKQLHIKNQGLASNNDEWANVKYTIDGTIEAWSGCSPSAQLLLAVIDSVTLQAYSSDDLDLMHNNNPNCFGYVKKFFSYSSNDTTSLKKLASVLNDSISEQSYVIVYSFYSGNLEKWPEELYTALEAYGATYPRISPNDVPYIFFGKKGAPLLAEETVGATSRDEVELYINLPFFYYSGSITSPLIGPVNGYNTLVWEFDAEESDSVDLDIIGVRKNGTSQILIEDYKENRFDNLNDSIDASEFPFLQLQYKSSDLAMFTPASPVKWQLYYDEIPETALVPEHGLYFYADTLKEGEILKLAVATKNISTVGMDSLLVLYSLLDDENQSKEIAYKRLAVHPSGDVLIDTLEFETKGLKGKNLVRVEYNPINKETGDYDQLEKFHYNNLYQAEFFIQKDERNPLLNVFFDGVRILDGDIVSAKPEIEIELKDDNEYFFIDDTSLFEINILYPNETEPRTVYFSDLNYNVEFEPASDKNKTATVRMRPTFTVDGVYTLTVNGQDNGGNKAGEIDYTISFEVVTKSTITHILNYPNPFSTSTKFVFTLTGSEVPSDLRIQITTISGRLVREISLEELGNVRVGHNITDFAWDGTDMYGDRLANGVYLYRVLSQVGGKDIEHRTSKADSYFVKGYGKMYLMR